MDGGDGTAQRALLALTGVMRGLKRRVGSEALDPAGYIVLHSASCAGGARVSELAASLGLDASTVSRHVKNLEEGGYLARSPDPQDRRAALISLSPHGQQVLERGRAARSGLVAEAMRAWPAADRAELVRLLERLSADLASDLPALADGPPSVPAGGARRTVPE